MRLLNRYILRQIGWPALLAVTAIVFVAVATEIQERLKMLPIAQIQMGDVTRMAFYFMPAIVTYVVPMTYMAGIMLAFGSLAQHAELTAMKAAGIPLKRIVMPVIFVGALLSGLCFLVQDQMQPWAIRKVYQMLFVEMPLRVTLDSLPTGVMQEFRDWRVYIGGRESGSGALLDITILKPGDDDEDQTTVYYAKSANIVKEGDQSFLEMRNGHLIPTEKDGKVSRLVFDSTRLPIPKLDPKSPQSERRGLTLMQLLDKSKLSTVQYEQTHSEPLKLELYRDREEIGQRLAMPFACLAVAFAAGPLAARARRAGRSFTFAAGFIIIALYYVLQMGLTPRDLYPLSTCIMLAWIPNIILCVAGAFLLWRVDRI